MRCLYPRHTACMYRKLADAIRLSDPVHLILFQGVTWEVVLPVGEQCVGSLHPLPTSTQYETHDVTASHRCFRYGFTEVPGGAAWANKSVLSWHNSVLGKITPDDECAISGNL